MTKPLNIAVAGAGVMGLCAAHVLRERGHFVTIYDPSGFPADNASAIAGGMLAPYAEVDHLPAPYIPAGIDGINFWQGVKGCGFGKTGSLIIAHNEDHYMLERMAQKLPSHQYTGIAALEPMLEKFGSGIFIPEEAHIVPRDALNSLLERQTHLIAQPLYPEAAQSAYDWVIECSGLAALSEKTQLRGVKGETVVVRNPEFTLNRPVRLMHPRYPLYIVPRPDHHFMIGATIIESEGKNLNLKSALELLSAAYSLHPSFAEADIVEINTGLRPAYPDNLPRITTRDNVISCNGLFRHGFLLAPAMAQCAADKVAGKENPHMHLFTRHHEHHHQWTDNETRRRA